MTTRAEHAEAQAQAAFRLVEILHEVSDIATVREGLQRVLITYEPLAIAGGVDAAVVRDYLSAIRALDGLAATIHAQRDQEAGP